MAKATEDRQQVTELCVGRVDNVPPMEGSPCPLPVLLPGESVPSEEPHPHLHGRLGWWLTHHPPGLKEKNGPLWTPGKWPAVPWRETASIPASPGTLFLLSAPGCLGTARSSWWLLFSLSRCAPCRREELGMGEGHQKVPGRATGVALPSLGTRDVPPGKDTALP